MQNKIFQRTMDENDKETILLSQKIEKPKSPFEIFCEISSIRGMHKIPKAPTLFHKFLWISFVLCMTSLLFLVTGFLVKDYLNYYTAWHVRTKFDDNSDFPAITLCSHNPFTITASKQWDKPEAFSPKKFRNRLREIVRDSVNQSDDVNQLSLMMFNDKIETFYSNLDYFESIKISHGEDMLKYCALLEKDKIAIVKNCRDTTQDTSLDKLIFSNRKYFNCYTLQKKVNSSSHAIDSLIIMVFLTPTSDIPQLKNAFLMDVLERGEGLKLVIHEPNTYPDIEQEGIDVQPGKMNNIKYEPVKWSRRSTPVQRCIDGQKPLFDLIRYFNYTFTFCMETNLQIELIKTCGCMSSLYPRPFIPNKEVGYCLNFVQNNIERIRKNIECADLFMSEIKNLKKSWENVRCTQRCNYFTYTSELSITKWVPSLEKIELISNLINETEIYINSSKNHKSKQKYISYVNFLNKSNSKADSHFEKEDRFTYISLSRKTGNTVIKDEQLSLDLAILISRIGGLCSLFIGLTVSFFVELIEFVYILYNQNNTLIRSTKQSTSLSRMTCKNCEIHKKLFKDSMTDKSVKNFEIKDKEKLNFITICESSDLRKEGSQQVWCKMEDLDNNKYIRKSVIETPVIMEL